MSWLDPTPHKMVKNALRTDHVTCGILTGRDVSATLSPYALSHRSILSELLHMNSILHSWQKTSGVKTEESPFPGSSRGCHKILFFPLHAQTAITFAVSDLSPVVHTSAAAPWAIRMPPGTNVILAELLPEVLST